MDVNFLYKSVCVSNRKSICYNSKNANLSSNVQVWIEIEFRSIGEVTVCTDLGESACGRIG